MTKRLVRQKMWMIFDGGGSALMAKFQGKDCAIGIAITNTGKNSIGLGYTVRPVIVEYEIPRGKKEK